MIFVALWDKYGKLIMIISMVIMLVVGFYVGYIYGYNDGYNIGFYGASLNVFRVVHAGSLTIPFQQIEGMLKNKYPNLVIDDEAFGSVDAVRQVTDLGREFDIVGVADYYVIRDLMLPRFTSWYIVFAGNEMVVLYTNRSKYASEIDENNWYKIIARPGVIVGVSDKDRDPSGYRAVLVTKLASMYYYHDNHTLYDMLYKNKYSNGELIIKPKEVDLLAPLESGQVDYVISYYSLAVQHHLNYVRLPPQVNLGDPRYAEIYSEVSVTVNGKVVSGQPIMYALTIPYNAPNKRLAIEFIKILLSEEGRKIIEKNGQKSFSPAYVYGSEGLPSELKDLLYTGLITPISG
ncbi:MAG: tungstate ABC transporter substrate-binding protein WtpA [Thermoprotei archaeon]